MLVAPATARAHVTDVVITSCIDVLDGKSFGETGPYEKCVGKIFFALDPENPRNRIIVDLDKAPRNALGEVEFSADLFVLRPKDPSRGNGVLFFDVVKPGQTSCCSVGSIWPEGPRTRRPRPISGTDF